MRSSFSMKVQDRAVFKINMNMNFPEFGTLRKKSIRIRHEHIR
ncbi:hypothetical protein CSB86_5431 [Pseudomonas aeruginosa]|nr:hypothetical protein CSB86_5431 [Pseudomonas aeruginosa]